MSETNTIELPDLSNEQWRAVVQLAGTVSEALAETFSGDDAPTAAELREYLLIMRRMMAVARTLRQFMDTDLADELTGAAVGATTFSRRHQLPEALADALITASHLHRNGTFARIREASDYVQGLGSGVETEQLADAFFKKIAQIPLEQAGQVSRAVDSAVREAGDPSDMGGLRGLVQLLQDPEVQAGIRTLASIPARLQETQKETPEGGPEREEATGTS